MKVNNKQDFLKVFQGSWIEKMGDNLTSADPLNLWLEISPNGLLYIFCLRLLFIFVYHAPIFI